jgi:hypothetical protein
MAYGAMDANQFFGLVTTDRALTADRARQLIVDRSRYVDALLTSAGVRHSALSNLLKLQLAWLSSGNLCAFSGLACSFDERQIIAEIASLESSTGRGKGKPAEPFGGRLRGFWHKHFFEARFMAKNLAEELEKNFNALFYRDFMRLWQNDPELKDETSVEKLSGLLSHVMVQRALENRAGRFKRGVKSRLTGEWIVFAKDSGRNFYLTLALHNETARAIACRIYGCALDFPFVLALLRSNGWNDFGGIGRSDSQ